MRISALLIVTALAFFAHASAQSGDEHPDWSSWLGPLDNGTYIGPPVADSFGLEGPERLWTKRIGGGYSGIACVGGRLYTMDYRKDGANETERVLCLDAATGDVVWEHSYPVAYGDLTYDNGPRCMPVVKDGRVFTIGAVGAIFALDAKTGDVLWRHHAMQEFDAERPTWGFAASAVIHEGNAIFHIGAQPGGCFVAFDQMTGEEQWRGGDDPAGYSTPLIREIGGEDVLLGWSPKNIMALSPKTGEVHWKVSHEIQNGVSIVTPIFHKGLMIVTDSWNGAQAFKLGPTPADHERVWSVKDDLRGLMSQPLYRGDHLYMLDNRNGVIGVEYATGNRLWTDEHQVTPEERFVRSSMVWIGGTDRALILNAKGELILARLTPEKYIELDRAQAIGTTWAHPAFCDGVVYARSDRQITALRLPTE